MILKSSNHVSEKHVTMKVKLIGFKNNLKFSKFFLILLILSRKIEKLLEGDLLSRKVLNSSENRYGIFRFSKFTLKKFTTGSHESQVKYC